MSSKSRVGISRSTALGVSLLGLSATLFAVDVAGTLALERERDGAGVAAGSSVASTYARPAQFPAEHAVRAAVLSQAAPVVTAAPVVAARVPFVRPSARPPIPSPPMKTIATAGTRGTASPSAHIGAHAVVGGAAPEPHESAAREMRTGYGVVPHTTKFVAQKRVNGITSQPSSSTNEPKHTDGKGFVARVTVEQQTPARERRAHEAITTVQPRSAVNDAAAPTRIALKPATRARAAASVVTLREVRRFVMYELKKHDRHVCVISAMTYPVADRQVVVDLVYRDDKGRWAEKAVVRRGGNAVKLIGVKQKSLPYRTVALTGGAPNSSAAK